MNWLRAFEVSARHLSFTSAAHELNLTQAGVSKQVRLLELHLRERLFIRKPRSLALTKAGAAYLPKVRDAFERLAAGTAEVFGHRNTGVLTIRIAASFAVNWVAPRLPDFLKRHPKIALRFVTSVWNEDSEGERFDLDIRYGKGKWPGYRVDRLTWEHLEPLCSPRLLRGKHAIRTPMDLIHHNLLHVLGYEESWAVWLRAAGVSDTTAGQGLHCDTSLMAFEVAAAGGGIALGRTSLAQHAIQGERLTKPFKLSVPVEEAFYLLSPDSRAEHPEAVTFRNWLVEKQHSGSLGDV